MLLNILRRICSISEETKQSIQYNNRYGLKENRAFLKSEIISKNYFLFFISNRVPAPNTVIAASRRFSPICSSSKCDISRTTDKFSYKLSIKTVVNNPKATLVKIIRVLRNLIYALKDNTIKNTPNPMPYPSTTICSICTPTSNENTIIIEDIAMSMMIILFNNLA